MKTSTIIMIIIGVAVAVGLAVLVVVVGFGGLAMNKMSQNKESVVFEALIAQASDVGCTEVPVTGERVDLLLRKATMPSVNNERDVIFQCLLLAKSTDGTDINAMISDYVKNQPMHEAIRDKLSKVLEGRSRYPRNSP